MTLNILLADDHKIMRDGLKALIESLDDKKIVGEASDGRNAVDLAVDLQPDVVVMDIGMPQLNGVDATKQIKSAAPHIKVIALSMHTDDQFISGMLGAGASGYLIKDCAFEEMAYALDVVAADKVYLSPGIAGHVVEEYLQNTARSKETDDQLTNREREVLQLLAEGKTSKEIAVCLDLSAKTVMIHRQKMMDKLNLHSIAELTKYALRLGLTSLDR